MFCHYCFKEFENFHTELDSKQKNSIRGTACLFAQQSFIQAMARVEKKKLQQGRQNVQAVTEAETRDAFAEFSL
ncbi:hypothetical protein K0M31_012004 [Melipona bicolor]|uniref:Uncharacterized protein n=1 Tax=Melipona bicolor TaxID=60889 RepID=A0AA40GAV3_9HYME|nr:hypothetical protein K0M31_012004 [Melipona bicolor]